MMMMIMIMQYNGNWEIFYKRSVNNHIDGIQNKS